MLSSEFHREVPQSSYAKPVVTAVAVPAAAGAEWQSIRLRRLTLDHDHPPSAVNIRHRDALDAMTAPLHRPPDSERLPLVPFGGSVTTGISRPHTGPGRFAFGWPRSSSHVGGFMEGQDYQTDA